MSDWREIREGFAFTLGPLLSWRGALTAAFAFPLGMHFIAEIFDKLRLSDALTEAVVQWRDITRDAFERLFTFSLPFPIPFGPSQFDAITLLVASLGIVAGRALLRRGESLQHLHDRLIAAGHDGDSEAAQSVRIIVLGSLVALLVIFGAALIEAPSWLREATFVVGMIGVIALVLGVRAGKRAGSEWAEAEAIGQWIAVVAMPLSFYLMIVSAFGVPHTALQAAYFLPLYGAVAGAMLWAVYSNWLGVPLALANAGAIISLDWAVRTLAPIVDGFLRYVDGLGTP